MVTTAEPDVARNSTFMGERYVPEMLHKRKDGRVFPVEITTNVMTLQGREVVIGAVRDTTDKKMAEEALRQANKKLNLLFGITRHDINNQMTILQGYLHLLKEKNHNAKMDIYCQEVERAAAHISSMIQFTKEYEKIGSSAALWQICHGLVETARKEVKLGLITLKNDIPEDAELFADPLIGKVFYNLLDNAVRYGGSISTIRFSMLEAEGNQVMVCEDDGEGVPAGDKELIFKRGFGKNTGLGLALSREILDITGILIVENGIPGRGARFEIRLPAAVSR